MVADMNDDIDWEIRFAKEEVLPQVIEQLTDYMDKKQQTKYQRKLTRYTRDDDKALLIAVDETGAIGFLCVAEYDEVPEELGARLVNELEDYATVTSFIVRPEHRRRGIGMSLFARALEWGKKRKPAGMWLITHRTHPWYHRHFALDEVAKIKVDNVTKTVMAITHI